MELETVGRWVLPHFDLASLRVEGYLLLGLYTVFLALILYLRRQDFQLLRGRRLLVFLALLLVTVPLNNLLWVRFPGTHALPPPDVPTTAPAPSVPLLGTLPILLAGVAGGAGPAMVVGLAAGLVRGGLDSSRVFAPAELATFGLIAGFLLRQTYRGTGWRVLRQPLAAALVAAAFHGGLSALGVYGATGGSGLSALDYTRSWLFANLGAVAVDGLLSGLLVQGLYRALPRTGPTVAEGSTPPYLRSMNRRLLAVLIPLMLVTFVSLFYAITTLAVKEATNQAVAGMVEHAHNAAEMIPLLFTTGQELVSQFAEADSLTGGDAAERQAALQDDLRTGVYGPFFSQLILVDGEGNRIDYYPQDTLAPELAAEERRVLARTLEFGSPERSYVFDLGNSRLMSFMVPVADAGGARAGALIGRTQLEVNPMFRELLAALEAVNGEEPGYVLDDRGLVAFRPNDGSLMLKQGDASCPVVGGLDAQVSAQLQGQVCQDLAPDGTRQLAYHVPVRALGEWIVVVTHPYENVLDRATRISGPLLMILLLVTGVLALIVTLVTSRVMQRLQRLVAAAHRISAGDLDDPVAVQGDDEVGQLGRAFEQMRLSLKGRLDDLLLLLRVSQAVSSNLDLSRSVPTVLEGALQATGAQFARLVLLNAHGDAVHVIAQGGGGSRVTPLDRAMARLGRRGEPVVIESISRARGLLDPGLVESDIQALIAVPMRSKEHDVGVMWLAYDHVHVFSETQVRFLSTLVGQAAVAVENAELFQAAEGERRRLAAILESTTDAVIVTDGLNRILLINPAAAEVFGVDAKAVRNLSLNRALQEERIIHLLTAPIQDGGALADEIPLPDGRTLYASASIIMSSDGQAIGRVAVLRDITYLKELDEMKSEFVATVSHDLRAPLTFMRGYATMIPMVGEVSSKQKMYIEKIMVGIEQMTELIDDLLDLGRIEAGVGLMQEPCPLDEIVLLVVDSMRAQAKAHGLTLELDQSEEKTIVEGDDVLLRRVISNLVDNAIKYTPQGGTVRVGWETRGNRVQVYVSDTGIGIAIADQVRLFEKFSRIKRRETIHIKGSGLGLAIVKSIVERHHGRVWVESELDQGSTFYVELPLGEPVKPGV